MVLILVHPLHFVRGKWHGEVPQKEDTHSLNRKLSDFHHGYLEEVDANYGTTAEERNAVEFRLRYIHPD